MSEITATDRLKPRCDAPLPFEPGPMCAREPGHSGPHVSASGLFRWSDLRSEISTTGCQCSDPNYNERSHIIGRETR